MAERPRRELTPVPGGWGVAWNGEGWTVTSHTTDRPSIRLSREQLTDLTCAVLADRAWPWFVYWAPDRSWAVVQSTADGSVLWCTRAQMEIVQAQLFDHVRTSITQVTDREQRRITRHRNRTRTHDHPCLAVTCTGPDTRTANGGGAP